MQCSEHITLLCSFLHSSRLLSYGCWLCMTNTLKRHFLGLIIQSPQAWCGGQLNDMKRCSLWWQDGKNDRNSNEYSYKSPGDSCTDWLMLGHPSQVLVISAVISSKPKPHNLWYYLYYFHFFLIQAVSQFADWWVACVRRQFHDDVRHCLDEILLIYKVWKSSLS